MATVVLQGELARRFLGDGRGEVEIEAVDYRGLVDALEQRFPGFSNAISVGTAVAIDGEIFPQPYLEAVGPHSEVHFLPVIGGG